MATAETLEKAQRRALETRIYQQRVWITTQILTSPGNARTTAEAVERADEIIRVCLGTPIGKRLREAM